MHKQSFTEFSAHLGRDMSFNVYGNGGKPVLVVPCQNGRYFDWEGFGMLETLGDYLESERLQLFCVDTIDAETLSFKEGDPAQRIRLHEKWFNYVIDELVPRIRAINGTDQPLMATGFSMGAYHAANFFFRRPDIFDSVISLSGIYDTDDMYGGYVDEYVYANDPCMSLANMPADHPYIEQFNRHKSVICVGQGAWEEPLLAGTRRLDAILQAKGIKVWVDYWGLDVNHDWPWWRKQIRYFLPYVLGE